MFTISAAANNICGKNKTFGKQFGLFICVFTIVCLSVYWMVEWETKRAHFSTEIGLMVNVFARDGQNSTPAHKSLINFKPNTSMNTLVRTLTHTYTEWNIDFSMNVYWLDTLAQRTHSTNVSQQNRQTDTHDTAIPNILVICISYNEAQFHAILFSFN